MAQVMNELTPVDQLYWQDLINCFGLLDVVGKLPLPTECSQQITALGAAFRVLLRSNIQAGEEDFTVLMDQYPWLEQFRVSGVADGLDLLALKKQTFLATEAAVASCREAGTLSAEIESEIDRQLHLCQYIEHQMQGLYGNEMIYRVSTHAQQHVAFPIGGYADYPKVRCPEKGETDWRSWGPFAVIEDGQLCVFRKFTYPMMLLRKSGFERVQLCLADGTVLDSFRQAGELFMAAYTAARPENGYATLLTPSAKVSTHQPQAGQFTHAELCALLGCEAVVLHGLPANQPFEGLTLVRPATGLWSALKWPGSSFPTTQELNSVASAIWLRAYADVQQDEDEKYYAANWLYGNVLLVNKAAIMSKQQWKQN